MKWVILAVGSRGDVQPFLALAIALQQAGEDVCLAALEPHRHFVESHQVAFASMGDLPERYAQQPRIKVPFYGLLGRFLFWWFYRDILRNYSPYFAQVCAGADRIIFSGLAFPVYHLAEAMKVPAFFLSLVPHTPTTQFVDPFFARSHFAGTAWFNRLSGQIENWFMLQLTLPIVNRWRQDELNLAAVNRRAVLTHRQKWITQTLYCYDASLLPIPSDWPDDTHATGFLKLPLADDWQPSAELRSFFHNGSKPLYVGFGSMVPNAAEQAYRAIFEMAAQLKERLVILAPNRSLNLTRLAEESGLPAANFHIVEDVPHEWLFKHVKLAIYHGGIGTLAAALNAGIPSLILPQNYDQFFWAELIESSQLGVNSAPTAAALTEAVSGCLHSAEIEQSLKRQQHQLQQTNGVKCTMMHLRKNDET